MIRPPLLVVLLLAAALHIAGVGRSFLPAQDGLKFIKAARQFQRDSWVDAVRGTDQHPLYPALVALAQPAVSVFSGQGPESWRIAAQGVSALASLALLIVLYGLTRQLFDEPTATMAALLFTLLPLPNEIGHEALSDPLALLGFALAIRLGEVALRTRRLDASIACGLSAGLGYLARPEVLVVPVSVAIAAMTRGGFPIDKAEEASQSTRPRGTLVGLSSLLVAFLTVVGSYALVKGELSEKQSLRMGAFMGPSARGRPTANRPLKKGLDDPRWDFSPKEEIERPGRLTLGVAAGRLLFRWAEGLGWIGALLAPLGMIFVPVSDRGKAGRRLAAIYGALFGAILVRHAMGLGYLSSRHALSLVFLSTPWFAAFLVWRARLFLGRFQLNATVHRNCAVAAMVVLSCVGVALQIQWKSSHPSRWGHWAAGRWLATNADRSQAILDTRGWASFVAGRESYSPWHIRQALTDARLTYVVVGQDELNARSERAATLRAILDYAASPLVGFPARQAGEDVDVRIYRFRRPSSWEGLGR